MVRVPYWGGGVPFPICEGQQIHSAITLRGFALPPTPAREAPGNQGWKSNFLAVLKSTVISIPEVVSSGNAAGFDGEL